ncbi:M1 family metallopeptidase [Kordiimonas aquimaris]|uniref:M1 family metallopeptidase n=1 Tax=Kordiimonas aquimaris TaxID=707591 RepID=UPI0021CFD4C5|nr:M1 family metallopeptidase [Kordiimonas aquimaris]
MRIFVLVLVSLLSFNASADVIQQTKGTFKDKFRQLDEYLPTPNVYRTGSGAPGHAYWQQKVDYDIDVTLDEANRRISGSQKVIYTNNSPDTLTYLWLQLDQNRFSKHSDAVGAMAASSASKKRMSYSALEYIARTDRKDWGFNLTRVQSAGKNLSYIINDTMMRIDLDQPLAAGDTVSFEIDWWFNIVEGKIFGARGGYEPYERDENDVYFISQWFPRLAAYTDLQGWEHKQFLGTGEFTLEFGNYTVDITVPADHIVGSTGELQNPRDVLTSAQRSRLKQAETADRPIFIVTREEALENEKERASDTKTWSFAAENVRDFAFGSSRKFVWDALGVKMPKSGRTVMAMSLYPDEAMPLWDKYSTHAIAHTLDTYSRYSFEYPYPVAWSVNGPIGGGMEYPMITSNGPKPVIERKGDEETRTYTKRAKYGLISVVIHEIGHIYFPMVVNSDERNWAWMDEGLNSFLQSQAEREWEANYPSRYGHPDRAVPYMVSPNQTPIMTQSDSIIGYFPNAYTKPAIALNILRETVMGRELFDFAFKEYSRRWAFKRPYPADFFRTMEDASSKDLDWFWRGWFYTTDHVDIAITGVTHARIDTEDPDIENQLKREKSEKDNVYIAEMRNNDEKVERRVDRFPELLDFYNENDDFIVTQGNRNSYQRKLAGLKGWEKELLKFGHELYFIDFENIGGLVMPLILKVEYTDGSSEEVHIAAEIWRRNPKNATKLLVRDKEIKSVVLDPYNEIADADSANNTWPAKPVMSRLELFKRKSSRNLMREVLKDKTEDSDEKTDD